MATNSSYIANVPKLKGRENYDNWAFAVKNFLILEGLSKYIEQSEESEVTNDNDIKARAKLVLTIDPSLYVHIKETGTTKELWTKLKSLFDDSGFTRRISLLRSLISIRLENCDSMASYVNQIIIGQKLQGTGFQISDEWIGSLSLAGLPEKYEPMIMAIEHSGISITSDVVKTKLLDIGGDVCNTGSALASKVSKAGRPKSKYHNNTVGNSVNNSKSVKNVRCFRCHQLGHFKRHCGKNAASSDNGRVETTNLFSAAFSNGNFSKSDWYVDSGASTHLTVNEDWIKPYTY